MRPKLRNKKKSILRRFSHCDSVADVLDCNIRISEFKLYLYHYIQFWTKTLSKDMKFLIPTSNRLNRTTVFFFSTKMDLGLNNP